MPSISVLLQSVHETVHTFTMKPTYTEPKIFTGGVDIDQWSKLSKSEQKEALSKPWYVYFSFRNPDTGLLKRQPNIKAGANFHTNKRDRLSFLKIIRTKLHFLLIEGFNPYERNIELENRIKNGTQESTDLSSETTQKPPKKVILPPTQVKKEVIKETPTPPPAPIEIDIFSALDDNPIELKEEVKPETKEVESEHQMSVAEAFSIGLKIKKSTLNVNSYSKYENRILQFQRWLGENEVDVSDIKNVTKKVVIKHLNAVLQRTSPRTRNNARSALSSFFTTLEDNELIEDNFILKINNLKSVPTRNKTYTPQLVRDIDKHMKENDPLLRLFVQFVSYNFLRPIEVCRLKIGDIDIHDQKLYVKAKNKPVKVKIIPKIMLDRIPDISQMKKELYLFTPNGIGGEWTVSETEKRNYFTKRFKKVKDHFKLGKDYGLYSFRHTFITRLYREMVKTSTPEVVKSRLMLITGHSTREALDRYLRDIDAALPEDYSNLLHQTENN
ncbi:tyrosine-type recombinase/integrase [Zobellia roscoffensis]|uniref:tyrosine-type recombinase/integrase n=1 Tax=Zobellia roscoffensis TaxID=2779508 RepID=UPI00188CE837|nr:site-specific integrase [Zobellia roscoffensis]